MNEYYFNDADLQINYKGKNCKPFTSCWCEWYYEQSGQNHPKCAEVLNYDISALIISAVLLGYLTFKFKNFGNSKNKKNS